MILNEDIYELEDLRNLGVIRSINNHSISLLHKYKLSWDLNNMWIISKENKINE